MSMTPAKKSSTATAPDVVIIGDIHLGSWQCRAKALWAFLTSLSPATTLVINGDVLNEPHLRKVSAYHHEHIVDLIRSRDNLVLLAGNHDVAPERLQRVIKRDAHEEYVLAVGGRRIVITHGHRFDLISSRILLPIKRKIGAVLGSIAYTLFKSATRSEAPFLLIRTLYKKIRRAVTPLKPKAIAYAKKIGAHAIVVGHDHRADADLVNGIGYYNAGSWVKNTPCTYLAITGDDIELHTFEA